MKNFFIVAALCIFASLESSAQVSFNPGLRGGVNFSHFTKGDFYQNYIYDDQGNYVQAVNDPFSSKTDFYIGFYGALKLTKIYTLQPEIDYTRQGTKVKANNVKLDVSYLSFTVINKFAFNEKFNVHVGPTLDFVVDKNFDVSADVDLAFILGAGFNITNNFGLEARVKKGIVDVVDSGSGYHSNVVFSLGATYTFGFQKQ